MMLLVAVPAYSAAAAEELSPEGNKLPEAEKNTELVLLIIADGLQASALSKTASPNIKGLGAAGLYAESVTSVFPEDTQSTISSILTADNPANRQNATGILSILKEKNISSSLFDGSEQFGHLKDLLTFVGEGPYKGSDKLVADSVIDQLSKNETYFNLVIFPELRKVLEEHGANSDEYLKQVSNTDNQVGRILHYLHTRDIFDNSLIVVTGTLGQPPLVMKGPQLKVGAVIPPVNITDISPTLAYLMGLKLTGGKGMVMYNAIKPRQDRTEAYLLSQRVNDLSHAYANALKEKHRLEEEKADVNLQQQKLSHEKQQIQHEIDVRDQEIAALTDKISHMKTGGIIVLVLLAVGYVVEYRILRKKFLMF